MASLPQNNLGLLELATRFGDANAIAIAEVLNKTIELQDAVFIKSNGPTCHTISRRSKLPAGSWRRVNDGVAPESSKTVPVKETIGMLESFSKVDAALAELSGDIEGFREQEDTSFVEGLGQTFATTFIYGNEVTSPESFTGLANRITSKTATNAVDGGGTGDDTTSIYVVQWGVGRCAFIYPPGTPVGLFADDLGKQLMAGETTGTLMENYVTHFTQKVGLCVWDDRCIQRICNIETSGTSNTFDDDDLIRVLNRLPYNGVGAAIYVNETIQTQMDIKAKSQTNINYSSAEFGGRQVTTFKGHPVRRLDSILDTESALS